MNWALLAITILDSTEEEESSTSSWLSWILIGIIVVAFIVMMIFSSRSNKKKQKEQEQIMNAIRPGNKVKTIGGVCGIIVEVNEEEGTFVLETGNEINGKSYMKFDKQAIYQTDAKPEEAPKKDEKSKKGEDGKKQEADDEPVFAELDDKSGKKDEESEEPAEKPAEEQKAE